MLKQWEWCNILSNIALVIISSLLNTPDHLSKVKFDVKIVDLLLYLKSISWKNNLASDEDISLNPTSSILNSLYLKNSYYFI